MNRLAVQTLRGIACLLLVFYHIVGSSSEQGLQIQSGWLRALNDALASVRMPLFALIAGCLAGTVRMRSGIQLRNKFERLILPMLTVGTTFALLQHLVPETNSQVHDLQLLHIVPVAHFWFLESLFLIFCLMTLLEKARALDRPSTWLLMFSLSVAIYIAKPGIIWFGIKGAAYLLPYFFAGLALTRFGWDNVKQRVPIGGLLILIGLMFVSVGLRPDAPPPRFTASMLGAGLCFSIGLWLLNFRHAWLALLGQYSYSIFLFHVFFTAFTRMALNQLAVTSVAIHLGVALAIGILGPILVHHTLTPSATLRRWLLGKPQRLPAPKLAPRIMGLA